MQLVLFLTRLHFKLAYCELRRNLGGSFEAMLVLALAASMVVGLNIAIWPFKAGFPMVDLATVGARFVFVFPVLALASAAGSVVVLMLIPTKTTMSFVLPLMPIARWQRQLSDGLVVIGLGTLLPAAALFSFVVLIFAVTPLERWTPIAISMACIALTGAALGRVLMVSLVAILTRLNRHCSELAARNVAAGFLMVAILFAFVATLPGQRTKMSLWLQFKHLPSRIIDAPSVFSTAACMMLLGCALALSTFVAALADRFPCRTQPARTRRLRFADSKPWLAQIWLEAVQWMKFPSNGTNFVLFVCLTAAATLPLRRPEALTDNLLSTGVLAFLSTFGVGSYGATRAHHWLFATTGKSTAWVWPKLMSVGAIWIACALVSSALLEARGIYHWDFIRRQSTALLVELAAGCLFGAISPVSTEQGLGNLFADHFSLGMCLSVPLLLSYAVDWAGMNQIGQGLDAAVFIALLAIYGLLAGRRNHQMFVPVL